MVTTKRIAVLGAGANGASIGADLTRAGHDVTLIEQWPAHVEAMRQRGVRIEMAGEVLEVAVVVNHLCEVATFTDQFDVVLVLVKAYDTRWAVQLIEPYVKPDGLVVGVQNGMTANVVAEVVGASRAMGCVIEISSTMYEPGIVHRHSGPDRSWFAVGSLDSSTRGREQEIADLLSVSGTVAVVDDILATKWMKIVSNSTVLVTTAILGLGMQEALDYPGMREVMVAAGKEALAAGGAQGFAVLPIFGLTAEDLVDRDDVVDRLLDTLYSGFVTPGTTTTILQDWTKGRRSEVDDINGRVVSELESRGLAAPMNRAVVELAHRIERHELVPSPENLALLVELASAANPAV